MKDDSLRLFRRQDTVTILAGDQRVEDRGILVPLNESRTALHKQIIDEIRGFEDFIYVFYGSSELPLGAECRLIQGDACYRTLTSRLVIAGKSKIAVRTVLERCEI